MTHSIGRHFAWTILVSLLCVSAVWASGATFAISGQGIALGEAKEIYEDGKPQPPQIHAQAELGKPFTLSAQGMILPRGGKASPGEPEAGAWSFDVKRFKELPLDKKAADKTMIVLRLEPTAVGRTRVRFAGKILGYEHTFDVMIEVVAATKR
jgi:hypothetical protein